MDHASMDAARKALKNEAELHRRTTQQSGLRSVWLLMRRTQAIQATQRDRGRRRPSSKEAASVDELLGELRRLVGLRASVSADDWHREVGRVVCEVIEPRVGRESLLDVYVDGPSGLADKVMGAVRGS
jgi:hypothetical protein